MHDCLEFKEKVFDLAFDELPREQRPAILAEVKSCDSCFGVYRSIAETLNIFDQASEAALPPPGYWQSYNEGLRTMLERDSHQHGLRRLRTLFDNLTALAVLPRAVQVAMVLMILSAGILWATLWRNSSQENLAPPIALQPEGGEKIAQALPPTIENAVTNKSGETLGSKTSQRPPRGAVRRQPAVGRQGSPGSINTVSRSEADDLSLLKLQTSEHLESVQLLLRELRNLRPSDDGSDLDVSFEKQMARRLLNNNMLLRRGAKLKGDLRAEDLLSVVEIPLLDIANLSDRNNPGEVQSIQDTLQRTAIISALQVHAAPDGR